MEHDTRVVTVTDQGKQKEKFYLGLPNIKRLKGYLQGFWNFELFSECFPAKNTLSDTDASMEVYGHTLHIEFKESKYALNRGQILKAIRQAKYSNITTVFVFGKKDRPTEYLKFTPDNIEGTGFIPCDIDSLKELFSGWSMAAEQNNLVQNRTEEWNIVRKYVW
jgi:hypothetical protein